MTDNGALITDKAFFCSLIINDYDEDNGDDGNKDRGDLTRHHHNSVPAHTYKPIESQFLTKSIGRKISFFCSL